MANFEVFYRVISRIIKLSISEECWMTKVNQKGVVDFILLCPMFVVVCSFFFARFSKIVCQKCLPLSS